MEKVLINKPLKDLSPSEWEALCDGCGKCCLHKFEDEDAKVHFTDVACKLFNSNTCRCKKYKKRHEYVKDCLSLTKRSVAKMNCLPQTCAYRLRYEGKPLKWWHYLVCGDRQMVHKAGISARGRVISETGLSQEEIEDRIVSWPNHKKALRKKGLVKG